MPGRIKCRAPSYVTNFRAVTSYSNRFEVLAAATEKTNTFWEVTPCSLIFTNVFKQPAAATFRVEE